MGKSEDTLLYELKSRREIGVYRKFAVFALALSLVIHMVLFLTYYVATKEPEERTVHVRITNYDMIQPPLKFDVKAPRMGKSIESIKEATVANTFTPREFRLTPPVAADAAPPTTPTATSASAGSGRGSEGSVFFGGKSVV